MLEWSVFGKLITSRRWLPTSALLMSEQVWPFDDASTSFFNSADPWKQEFSSQLLNLLQIVPKLYTIKSVHMDYSTEMTSNNHLDAPEEKKNKQKNPTIFVVRKISILLKVTYCSFKVWTKCQWRCTSISAVIYIKVSGKKKSNLHRIAFYANKIGHFGQGLVACSCIFIFLLGKLSGCAFESLMFQKKKKKVICAMQIYHGGDSERGCAQYS